MEADDGDFLCLYRPSSASPTVREERPETKVWDLVNDMHLSA